MAGETGGWINNTKAGLLAETGRSLRAEAYVLGRMGHLERERAEIDLEEDAPFRDAVLQAALRLGFDGQSRGRQPFQSDAVRKPATADAGWAEIAAHLTALPHMGAIPVSRHAPRAATKGALHGAGPKGSPLERIASWARDKAAQLLSS